jgi:type IV pilus modification protein PilV
MAKKQQEGFSLIEVVLAILILTIGLIALAGGLVAGVTLPQRARQQEIAKQLATETMESIIFAKEATPAGFTSFDSIGYTTDTPPGRFISQATNANISKMLSAGPDGVYGTCDDGQPPGAIVDCGSTGLGANMRTLDLDPGPDGKYSTSADNKTISLTNFSRKITITNLTPTPVSAKQIQVDVTFLTSTGAPQTVTLVCRITNFRTL